jgi:23S rRNA C2498 (ribose-2'-O)-methylase RlmM
MNHSFKSQYFFTYCNVDAEHYLKDEVSQFHPQFKPSFMKKGFVSFKSETAFTVEGLPALTFARLGALFVVKGALDEVLRAIENQDEIKEIHYRSFVEGSEYKTLEDRFMGTDFRLNQRLKRSDLFFVVVQLSARDFWLGLSQVRLGDWKIPDADPHFVLPEQAPSRAYLKILEAIEWSGAEVRAGDLAIEIGSSPGGACLALLEKGLEVVGVDRAQMDPQVKAHPRFRHQPTSVHFYNPSKCGEFAQWVLLDMSNKPRLSLPEALRLAESCRSSVL